MDNVREKLREQTRNRRRKLAVWIIALIVLTICAILVERSIGMRITDVSIEKSKISDEKAKFIPIRQLNTNIIAVQLTDGTYRLAFDDCTGCYTQYGKHAKYKNNSDNTGLICKNCKSEVLYEDMGFLTEESMPYPIYEMEITVEEEKFVLSDDYLEKHKILFEELRKGNAVNPYSENPAK